MSRCASLWLVIVLSAHVSARADAVTSGESQAYKSAVASGIEEFERGNMSEAREHFMRAHGIDPNARTLRGLGMSEFELRNYVDAVDYLERALASQEKPLQGALREETDALLVRARAYVGVVQLKLTPASTSVRVDGFVVALGPERRLRLPVGDHALEFTAPDRLSERHAIKLRGEQVLELSLELAPQNGAQPVLTTAVDPGHAQRVERPLYTRWWLWTSVGVALVAGSVAAAVVTTRDHSTREPNGGSTGDTIRF